MGARKTKPEEKLNKDIGKHKECEIGLTIGHKDFKTGGNFYLGYKTQIQKNYKHIEDKKKEENDDEVLRSRSNSYPK